MGENYFELPILEPCEFQLANGNSVKVVFAFFWERLTDYDVSVGELPRQYFAIRIYSNEDELSNHMSFHHEFRDNHDFNKERVDKIWDWLTILIQKRGHLEFDALDDFITDFAEQIAVFLEEEAVEHIEQLPEIQDSESFDKVDDSVFNDQNDQ